MKRQPKRKFLAALLAAALLLGQTLPALAVTNDEGPPCENHQHHDADCGYVEGSPCGHTEHTADCYTDELICGLDGDAVQTATDSEADEPHEHTQECYALDCPHERGEHNDVCGYGEARPCTHGCELCATKDSGTPPDTSGQNVQKSTPSEAAPAMVAAPAPNSTIDGNGYSFNPDDGKLTVSSNDGTTEWRKNSSIDKTAVTSVVVEDGVDTIGVGAFWSCTNLTQATLPDSINSIEASAFRDCASLELSALPNNLTTIKEYAFSGCTTLALTELPSGVTTIRQRAFVNCTNLVLTKLPDNLSSIGIYAFAGCTSLELTALPDNLTSIEQGAFSGCNLKLTALPDKVSSIGASAFYGCTSLALTELPSGVTSIGNSAFSGCTSLALTKIPGSVTTLGNWAFENCTKLTSLTLSKTEAPTLGTGVFDSIPNLVLFIPHRATGYDTGNWASYTDKVVYGAALTGLTMSEGSLVPSFSPKESNYAVSVPGTVAEVTVNPISHSTGTITVNGKPVDSENDSENIPLTAGGNTIITVLVKNSDTDSRTYTITVTRGVAVVNMDVIRGVIPPALGATPVTKITDTTQYTGTVAWSPNHNTFAADTEYTATITLSPKPGYTLQGVVANFFKVNGATSVSNAENSGMITAKFPRTSINPVYSIRANTAALDFGTITVNDAPPIEKSVTVENTGNQSVTLTQPTATSYDVGALSKTTLAPGETATFTVRPQAGLSVGSYSRTLSITPDHGAAVTVNLSFTVKARESSSSGGGGSSGPSYYFRTLTDKASGIKVEGRQIHEYAALTVKAGGLHNARDAGCDLLRTADKAGRVLSLYDVSLSRVFRGSVTVSIPVEGRDGQTLTVAHCIGGKLTLSNVTVKNGMAAVTAEELSPFAVLDGVYTLDTLAAPAAGNPFADVKESDWYYNAVLYAYQNGLMNGTTSTTFDPLGAVTRAQPPVVLYRLEGSPAVTAQNPFADVRPGLWYANGITWAAGAGLVDGYNATTYGPGDAVTREQLAVMLWRYAKYKGWDVSMGEDTNILSYADAFDVSEWAIPALQWACGAGIMTGNTDNRLAPKAGATRAELAQMLQRLMEKYQQPAAPVNPSTGASKARRVRVQKGDTLSGLARKYNSTVTAIVQANSIIKNPSLILPGWELDIP